MGMERKTLKKKSAGVQQEIDRRVDRLPCILNGDGYPDVPAFKRLNDRAAILVEQYNRDLASWERQVHGEQQPQQALSEREHPKKAPGYGSRGKSPERHTTAVDTPSQPRL